MPKMFLLVPPPKFELVSSGREVLPYLVHGSYHQRQRRQQSRDTRHTGDGLCLSSNWNAHRGHAFISGAVFFALRQICLLWI